MGLCCPIFSVFVFYCHDCLSYNFVLFYTFIAKLGDISLNFHNMLYIVSIRYFCNNTLIKIYLSYTTVWYQVLLVLL